MLRTWEECSSHLSCDAVVSKVSFKVYPLVPEQEEVDHPASLKHCSTVPARSAARSAASVGQEDFDDCDLLPSQLSPVVPNYSGDFENSDRGLHSSIPVLYPVVPLAASSVEKTSRKQRRTKTKSAFSKWSSAFAITDTSDCITRLLSAESVCPESHVTNNEVCSLVDAETGVDVKHSEVTLIQDDDDFPDSPKYKTLVPSENYLILPVESQEHTQGTESGQLVQASQKFNIMSLKSGQLATTINVDIDDSTEGLSSNADDRSSNGDNHSESPSRRSSVQTESDTEKTYKCLLCNDEFEEQDSLHCHIATHGTPDCHQCNECGKIFTRLASLQAHTAWHLRTNKLAFTQSKPPVTTGVRYSKSKQGKKSETSSEDPKTDMEVRCQTSQTAEKPRQSVNLFSMDDIHIGPLMCTFCKQTFKSQEGLCNHVAANHALKDTSEKPAQSSSKSKKKKDTLVCDSCSKTFLSQEGLDRHKLVVHKSVEFHTCDTCSSSFSSKSNLLKHVSTVHRKTQCSSSSSAEEKADDDVSLVCPMCGQSFQDDDVFQNHLDSHDARTAARSGPKMRCGMCHTEFANPQLLKDHQALEHSRSNSPRNPVLQKAQDCCLSSRSSSPSGSPLSRLQVRAIQPCVICTENGRKIHETSPEKSMSCKDCVQFFVKNLRLLIFGGKLKCDYKGKCLITRDTMESCAPCHLRLCIATFPVLEKLQGKALAIKKLDSNQLDRVFSILSSQCLHQSNCKRFMKALDGISRNSVDETVASGSTSAKSKTTGKPNNSGTKGKGPGEKIATKRPSSSSSESPTPKKAKPDAGLDETVKYIDENDDDVICIDDDVIEDSSSLIKDISGNLSVSDDDDDDDKATTSQVSQEKPKPKSKGTAKKRTSRAILRRSSGSTASSAACSIPGSSDAESAVVKSRTTSAEEDFQSVADHAESLDRSGLELDEHLVTLFTKMADWAKPSFWMWTLVPFDLNRLKEYNERQAEIGPHCAICQLFINDESECPKTNVIQVEAELQFLLSVPVMPESLFRGKPFKCKPNQREKTPPICKEEPQNATVLVSCKICAVRVHAKCYGIDMEDSLTNWKCAICQKETSNAECCLCFVRGGALQATTDGRWCHIVCALGIPEVFFENVEARKPINVTAISSERKKLKCRYCSTWTKEMRRHGTCAQCWDSTRCCAPLHVTCGKAAGDTIKCRHDDARIPVYVICRRHTQKAKKSARLKMPKVEAGQPVTAKAKNGRYYKATVKSQFMQIFYEVDFSDGSFSKDLYPEDIMHRDCRNCGPPPIGSDVEVIWTDKKIYPGIFKGVNNSIVYKVEFEDTSVVKLKREEFFSEGETLPEDVRKKLSTATPSKFDFDVVFARAPSEPRPRCSHYPS